MYEQAKILSVNTHKDVRWLHVKKVDLPSAFDEIASALKSGALPLPQFLDTHIHVGGCSFLITAPQETLTAIAQSAANASTLELGSEKLASVTATCQGAFASPLPAEIASHLRRASIPVRKMIFGAMSVTAIVDAGDCARAVQTIHDLRPNPSPTA